MKIIKEVIKHMHDTLNEVSEYYKEYIIYKEEHPKYAQVAMTLAREHMDHYNELHQVVANLITDYRNAKGDAPEAMKVIWNYEHENLIEEFNKLKILLNS